VDVVDRIRRDRVVAVLRGVDDVPAAVNALVRAGVEMVEVTLDSAGGLADLAALATRADVCALAGTVRTPEQVDAAVGAGAAAIVCPAFSGAVVARAQHHAVPVIPAALTPTEIEAAWRAGAALVKLFPARLGGPRYVADVLKPLADVPLLCTGGVTVDSAADYLAAGAVAVGVSFGDAAVAAEDAARLLRSVR
jgi:2-dehydro-3-deoxyphosphogluconate aldolase / (4S)-4-hydroxy-2-oxoglutarate aldolase